MEISIDPIEVVVHGLTGLVGEVLVGPEPGHGGGGIDDVVVSPESGSGRDRGEHRGPEGRRLTGLGDPHRPPGYVGGQTHQESVLEWEATTGHDFLDRDPGVFERVDDDPGAEHGGLEQGPIDLPGLGSECEPHHEPGQVGVHQDRAIAVPPVEGDEARFPGSEAGRLVFQRSMFRLTRSGIGPQEVGEPGKHVSHRRLARLVPEHAGDHAVLDDPAEARNDAVDVGQGEVAGAGAHDRHQAPRAHHRRRGDRDVGVDVGHRHRSARRKPGQLGSLAADDAGALAGARDLAGHLLVDDVGEARGQGGEELAVGESVLLRPERLVTGGAGVPGLDPGELPDHPVGGFDQPVGPRSYTSGASSRIWRALA